MRVVVNEDMKVFHGHVPVELKKGQEVDGSLAEMLLAGAPRKVSRVDAEPAADSSANAATETGSEVDTGELDVAGSTIDQVLAWVGVNPERALAVHATEEARGDKARTTLLAKLAEIGLG